MKRLFTSTAVCAALMGCALNRNDPVATYQPQGDRYVITMTGKRGNMAHDPISSLLRGSSSTSLVLTVPRLVGEVGGSEIPVLKGYYSYLGSIRFSPPYIDIDLYYNDTDHQAKTPTTWNGRYLLKQSGL